MIKKKNILITGAHGFIARHLSNILSKKNFNVYGIGNKRKNLNKNIKLSYKKLSNKKINYNNLKNFKSLDIIIHCAGTGTVRSSNKEHLLKNYITTKSLIKFCKSIKEKPKIIFLSSYSIYGEKYNRPIKEYFKTNPKSCYSKTKKKSEDALIKLKNSHKINIKILRLASIYGNGIEKQLLFDVCKKIQNNSGDFYGTGDEVRDWMHISDLGSLILKIIRANDRKNTIINCGSGKGQKVKFIINKIKRGLKSKVKISFTKKDSNHQKFLGVNNNLARTYNWNPKININEGITQYINWYKKKYG